MHPVSKKVRVFGVFLQGFVLVWRLFYMGVVGCGLFLLVFYSRSQKVGNPIASILKSHV